jgi:hypothetical protein
MTAAVPPNRPPWGDAPDDPEWFRGLKSGLSRWKRPAAIGVELEPADVADELAAWVHDESRWTALRSQDRDWRSLLSDAAASWSMLGVHLERMAGARAQVTALQQVLAAPRIREDLHRSEIETAAAHLATALDRPGALLAAFEDVLDAAQRHARPGSLAPPVLWLLALMASAGERHGHDWAVVADRVRHAVEWFPDHPFADRIDSVRRTLQSEPEQGHSIVWLSVDHASAWGPSPVPAVELFDGDWLLAVLREWNGPRDDVPSELAADPELLPRLWHRLDKDQPVDQQLPVVFARIDLGHGPTAGARERARDTLELLLARASVLQGGTHWRISGNAVHFVDGESVYESSGPVGDPDVYDRLTRSSVLHGDPTAETIKREAVRLIDHLPVTDRRLRSALQLAQWLHDARLTAPPARLVLSSRIIEQCAGWAELRPRALVLEHLAWPWCWDQLADELERAGRTAVLAMPGHDGTTSTEQDRQAFLDVRAQVLEPDHGSVPPRADPWKALEWLGWLTSRFPPDDWIGHWLTDISARVADGRTVAAWLERLEPEFVTQHGRAVRTRNLIVHGGPLLLPTARSIVGFQDALATRALEWTMDGLLSGATVAEHFAQQRLRYADALDSLRIGADPVAALPAPTRG